MKYILTAGLAIIFMVGVILIPAESSSNRLSAKEISPLTIFPVWANVHGGISPGKSNTEPTDLPAQNMNPFLYLPLVLNNSCSSTFTFNEAIGYNLTAIKAAAVWDCHQGQGITVAIIDTGIDLDHPDLQANLVAGQTFVAGTSSPDDDQGHGTHVAGVVAGVANNGGLIGVAPGASLMPVKVLDSTGSGTSADVAEGIIWAADNGAQIINLSLGSTSNSSTIADDVDYAHNNNVLLVAAAGNCGDSSYFRNGCRAQDQPSYPAALAEVIAVAATDENNNQASFSNKGDYVELAAPGNNISSTYLNGGYSILDGTSQATPHAAGVAALVWSQTPTLSNETLRSQLRITAQDLGTDGWDKTFGYGLIDAEAALEIMSSTNRTSFTGQANPTPTVNTDRSPDYVSGEILLKLADGADLAQILDSLGLKDHGIQLKKRLSQLNTQQILVTKGKEEQLLEKFRTSDKVLYAELNHRVTIR